MIRFQCSAILRDRDDRAYVRWVGRAIGKRFPFLSGTIGLHFVGPVKMQQLNAGYRRCDRPTNVLSFPSADLSEILRRFPQLQRLLGARPKKKGFNNAAEPWSQAEMEWGEIFLCWSVIRAEAIEQNEAIDDRMTRLLLHGCLHLFGFRHDRPKDARVMERIEDQLFPNQC